MPQSWRLSCARYTSHGTTGQLYSRPTPRKTKTCGVIFRSIALDQVRAIDRSGLIRKMTHINAKPALDILSEMFAA